MDARDDLIINDQYSFDAHHDEEAGKKIRKKIWFVTFLLSVITILEVGFGIMYPKSEFALGSAAWNGVQFFYIVLTLVKAGYIVLVFMHLGDENKYLKYTILIPYLLFIGYLIFICLTEGMYVLDMTQRFL